MDVRVIAVTKPVIDNIDTPDDLIAYVARVSNPDNQNNKKTAPKLLKYLRDNSHWSPFEMANVVMEINTTRDIGRQILRHRSYAFQEFSQRYADATELGFELRECRLQDPKNRQNSTTFDPEANDELMDLYQFWQEAQEEVLEVCKKNYRLALENGIAKEQARALLPEGLTKSRMYMNGSLRSWIHYCDLRRANGTQKEHMEIAEACWKAILPHFPSLKADTADGSAKKEK